MRGVETRQLASALRDFAAAYDLSDALNEPLDVLGPCVMPLVVEVERRALPLTLTLNQALDILAGQRFARHEGESALLMWGAMESWLWGKLRARDLELLRADGVNVTLRPGLSREQLEAWAAAHGVSQSLDERLAATSYFNPYLSALQSRWWRDLSSLYTVAQLLSPWPAWEFGAAPTAPQQRDALELLQASVARQRQARDAFIARQRKRVAPPEGPLANLYKTLSEAVSEAATRYEPALSLQRRDTPLVLDEEYALLIYTPTLATSASPPCMRERVVLSCEQDLLLCGCDVDPGIGCAVRLAAAETILDAISAHHKQPSELGTGLERIVSQPAWARQLGRVMDELDQTVVPEQIDGMPAWLGWRLQGDLYDLSARPVVARHKKRQDGVITRTIALDQVPELLGEIEDRRDRELLRAWLFTDGWRTGDQRAYDELLLMLVGHPHVYFHDTASRQITVRQQLVTIHADAQSSGALSLRVAVDGAPITDAQREQLRAVASQGARVLAAKLTTGEGAELVLWEMTSRVRNAMLKLPKVGDLALPEEAREQVVDRASRQGIHRALSMDDSLRGRPVAPQEKLVARVSLSAGQLNLALRVVPLALGPAMIPAEGPTVIFGLDEQGPVYTQRDFARERRVTDAMRDTLALPEDAEQDSWIFESIDTSLETLTHIQATAQTHDGLALQWDRGQAKLHTHVGTGNLSVKISAQARYFSVGGALNLDGASAPLDQLLDAVRDGQRWVAVGADQFVRLEESLRRDLAKLAATLDREDASLSPLAAPLLMELEAQGAIIEGPPQWATMTSQIEAAHSAHPEPPATLQATLRAYQRDGFAWMSRLAMWAPGAVLADDMGLGKTIQALALLLSRVADGPALVVAPASVGINWSREAAQFAPSLTVHPLRSGADVEALAQVQDGAIYIIGYDLLTRHIDALSAHTWGTLVLDEAQAIKNAATRRARAMRKIDAGFRLVLTGTPLENHAGELWSLFDAALPGLLGTQAEFRRRYQVPMERYDSATARASLAALISPFVLRRLKREVARELPARTDIRLDVTLSDPERRLYDELRRAVLNELEGDKGVSESARFDLLAAITRLRQLACHPKLYNPQAKAPASKLDMLCEKIAELRDEGHQALVFSQFTSLLKLAREALEAQGARCAYLDGSLSASKRQAQIDAFQAGEHDVFLLSIKAGGTGLNLTAASFVFLLDPWWNPAVEDQATDRAHRIGQTQPVTVYRLVTTDTIEEAIYTMHGEKRALMDAVLSESGSARALTPEELRALIAS